MIVNKEESIFFASDVRGNHLHISEVQSGRKGYFCIGCKAELVAIKGEIYTQHFRHHADDVARANRCQYKDEQYRHKIGKEILQRLKKIKVPSVVKLSPELDGTGYVIKQAHFVEADSVEIELSFYEDDNGNIVSGRNCENDTSKHFLIRPDVTFLDKYKNPILFIELVATHKVTDEKLYKIRLLGIDTVEVMVPMASAESIEKAFLTTSFTKWLFNYEQENTIYAPKSNSDRVSQIDEFEKRVHQYGETYECTTAKISNLIRNIRKYLESESYQSADRNIGIEISRVQRNQEAERLKWESVRRTIEDRVGAENKLQEREFEKEEKRFGEEKQAFEREYGSLEERYKQKDSELRADEDNYRREWLEKNDKLERDIESEEQRISELEAEIRRLTEWGDTPEERIELLKRNFEGQIEDIEYKTTGVVCSIEKATSRIPEIAEEFRRELESGKATLESEFAKLRETATSIIKSRDSSGVSTIAKGVRDLLEGRRFIQHIIEKQCHCKRLRRAHELFDQKAYKSWKVL